MTNQERIQANNTELQECIELAESLPDAGGGSEDSFYDSFWDTYQKNGTLTDYDNAFNSEYIENLWTVENFKPKYDIIATSCMATFYRFPSKIDLTEYMYSRGLKIEFKGYLNTTYRYAQFTRVPECNVAMGTTNDMRKSFSDMPNLITIDKIVVDKYTTYTQTFYKLYELVNITFEGEIGNSIDLLHSSKLSDSSIQNIIDSLADLTGTTAQTLTFHADVKAKLTQTQLDTITSKNWNLA